MPKPNMKSLLIMIMIGAVTVTAIYVYTRFRIPPSHEETNPIVEEIIDEIINTENP